MTTASLSRRVLTGLLGLTIAAGLPACAPMPSLPDPGAQNPDSQSPGAETPGQPSGGDFSTDLTGGVTTETTYGTQSAPLYQKQGVMCMPDWVAVPTGAPVFGQYMEVYPDSATDGAAVCVNAWDAASAAGITQNLPAKSAEAMPAAPDFELLRVTMAGHITTAFRNPLISASTFDQLRDAYASDHGAQVDAYGDEGRTLIVITPAADDPTAIGVVFGVVCSGRC
ncbi:MAG TPA: hypothetical protein PK781_01950 [Terrimesophilobacter sp.]|nr:hypothetical protein [Terrimesophilobacter sp.]HRP99206.1 hypothetical protein [Terrimesophilobacter sp.]